VDSVGAERHAAGRLTLVDANAGFKPLALGTNQRDERDGRVKDVGRRLGEVVEAIIRRRVEDILAVERLEPIGRIIRRRRVRRS
jgi:hypothetical protein